MCALLRRKQGGAGNDACASAAVRKTDKYSEILGELQEDGYSYHPLVWSTWGRPGHDAQAAVRTLAAVAARRRGLGDARGLEARAKSLIGATIWKRAASMVRVCLYRPTDADAFELLGGSDEDWRDDIASDGGRSAGEMGLSDAGAAA